MTETQKELLTYLSTRKGVVPLHISRRPDLYALHDLGLVAIFADGIKGDFAEITDDGRRLADAGQGAIK